MPLMRTDNTFVVSTPCRRGIPDQFPPIVDRPIEIELLAEFDLPLFEDGFGCQDQDPFGPSGKPRLAQQQARLYGLAEANLVGDQESGRPIAIKPFKSPHLVWPGGNRRGHFADALTPMC